MFEILSASSPTEIDTEICRLAKEIEGLQARVDGSLERLHALVGDSRERRSPHTRGRGAWKLTRAETILRAEQSGKCFELLKGYRDNSSAIDDREALIRTLSVEYARRPWSRFFEVVSSPGHIHESTSCSTCRPTTRFGWHPELAGKTEKAAVEACGPYLCSVCFPSAPVSWTRDRADVKAEKDRAAGVVYCSGVAIREGTYRPRYPSGIGECAECGTVQTVTSTGRVRKHRVPSS